MNKISVVVVTKNRFSDLSHCLGSILSNSEKPYEIIIVDNNSSDQTRQLATGLLRNSQIPVIYCKYVGSGYPKIYNKGLSLAKGDWIAVIDDDCVAHQDWIKQINFSIEKHRPDVIMGWCDTYYSDNVYSLSTLLFDNEWKERSIKGDQVIDFEILDNKNIVYKKKFLSEYNLKYDESRADVELGAAEDCDLGIQVQEAGGKAVCNKKILVWHKDPQNFLWLINKTKSSFYAYQSLLLKWPMEDRQKLKKESRSLSDLVGEFSQKYQLNFFQKAHLFIVCKITLWFNIFLNAR